MNKCEAAYTCVPEIPTDYPVISNSPNLPWTALSQEVSCNRISSYPSPVVSFEVDFQLSKFNPQLKTSHPIHIMLDSGANVSFLLFLSLKKWDLKVT